MINGLFSSSKQNLIIGAILLLITYYLIMYRYKEGLFSQNNLQYKYAYRNTPDSYGWYEKNKSWSLIGHLKSNDIYISLTEDSILNLYAKPNRVNSKYYEYKVETPNSNICLDPYMYTLLRNDDEIHVSGLEHNGPWTVVLNEF